MANVSNKLNTVQTAVNDIRTALGVSSSTIITSLAGLIPSTEGLSKVYYGTDDVNSHVFSETLNDNDIYIKFSYYGEMDIQTNWLDTNIFKLPLQKYNYSTPIAHDYTRTFTNGTFNTVSIVEAYDYANDTFTITVTDNGNTTTYNYDADAQIGGYSLRNASADEIVILSEPIYFKGGSGDTDADAFFNGLIFGLPNMSISEISVYNATGQQWLNQNYRGSLVTYGMGDMTGMFVINAVSKSYSTENDETTFNIELNYNNGSSAIGEVTGSISLNNYYGLLNSEYTQITENYDVTGTWQPNDNVVIQVVVSGNHIADGMTIWVQTAV